MEELVTDTEDTGKPQPEPVSASSSTSSFRISETGSNSAYSLQNTQSKTSAENTNAKVLLDPYGNPITVDQSNFYHLPTGSSPTTNAGSFYFTYGDFDDPNLNEEELEDK